MIMISYAVARHSVKTWHMSVVLCTSSQQAGFYQLRKSDLCVVHSRKVVVLVMSVAETTRYGAQIAIPRSCNIAAPWASEY